MRKVLKVNINGEFNHIVVDDFTLAETIVRFTTDGGVRECFGLEDGKSMKKKKSITLENIYLRIRSIFQLSKLK